jgi:cytoskeletal protein RodZ
VFDIGNTLREARLKRGLDFYELEQATKVRAKYLRALENEQFDILPAQTYVKGFLRAYADFLGLDGQLFVDEYTSRFTPGATAPAEERQLRPRRSEVASRREPRRERNAAVLAVLAIAVVTALVIAAWRFGGGTSSSPQPAASKPKQAVPAKPSPLTSLTVTAQHGSSLLQVRLGSASGRTLYQGTLVRGQRESFKAKLLWLNIGTPENLEFELNGRELRVGGAKPCVLLVSKRLVPAGPDSC